MVGRKPVHQSILPLVGRTQVTGLIFHFHNFEAQVFGRALITLPEMLEVSLSDKGSRDLIHFKLWQVD